MAVLLICPVWPLERVIMSGTSIIAQIFVPLSPQWFRLLSVLRRWFCCCWLFLPLWDSVIFLCFVMRYFVSILVLQSSWWGRESWLLCWVCLLGVSWWLCGWYHGFVCSLWLWVSWSYSLTINIGKLFCFRMCICFLKLWISYLELIMC